MSTEKTEQCKGLFTALLNEVQTKNTSGLILTDAELLVLKNLHSKMPTPALACKALIAQLIEYKKAAAYFPLVKQNIHQLMVKILFTFMAFQDSTEQKTLLEMLSSIFPKGHDEDWDKLLLNLERINTTQLPGSQNVHVVLTSTTDCQTFIQELLKLKAQAPLLPLNETLIVSLLIAGAEKAQTYAKTSRKGALSFTDEGEITAFIQQNFDVKSAAILLDIYKRNLRHSRFFDFLQKKSFPLAEKLKVLKKPPEEQAALKMLSELGKTDEHKGFSEKFTALRLQGEALFKKYELIEKEANIFLQDGELSQEDDGVSDKKDSFREPISNSKEDNRIALIQPKLAAIEEEYTLLDTAIKIAQAALDQRMEALSNAKKTEYCLLSRRCDVFNREVNQSLYQTIALKLAFNRAKAAHLIPLIREEDPLYQQKMTSVAQKFTAMDKQTAVIKSFQRQQAQLMESQVSIAEFAKLTVVKQYQIYETCVQKLAALEKTFNENLVAVANPMSELNEIKESLNLRIQSSKESLANDRVQLNKLNNEKTALDKKRIEFEENAISTFKTHFNKEISASNVVEIIDKKITALQEVQKKLDEDYPNLLLQLTTSSKALANDIQLHREQLDKNFHPLLNELVSFILKLFGEEDLSTPSWLGSLKEFLKQQQQLEKNIESAGELKYYLTLEGIDVNFSDERKKVFLKIQQMLHDDTIAQLQNAPAVLNVISALLTNNIQQETNSRYLRLWLEPLQKNINDLTPQIESNNQAREAMQQIINDQQSKLDVLEKIYAQFCLLTSSWEIVVRQLVTGEIQQLNEFLTAIDSVAPPSDIVVDLLQYAVEFGAPNHVKCLVEKYPLHVNIPLTKKVNQPTILLLSYERMRNRNSQQHEPVHIFYDLLKRTEIDINIPNHTGNTLLNLAVANNDMAVVNNLLSMRKTSININRVNSQGDTVLCQAIWAKNSAMINLLLANGGTLGSENLDKAKIDLLLAFRDDANNTLLHLAVLNKNLPLVKQLVVLKGTDCVVQDYFSIPFMDEINANSKTALSLAKKHGSPEIVKFLEQEKARIIHSQNPLPRANFGSVWTAPPASSEKREAQVAASNLTSPFLN